MAEKALNKGGGPVDIVTVKLEITDERGCTATVTERLEIANVPKAWQLRRAEPKEGEKKGYGSDRLEAVVDWLSKNYINEHGPAQVYRGV